MGWGKEEKEVELEKKRIEKKLVSSLLWAHNIDFSFSSLQVGRFLHVPSCPIFFLHPTGPFSIIVPSPVCLRMQGSESQPSEACPLPSPDTHVQSPKYSGSNMVMSLHMKESES